MSSLDAGHLGPTLPPVDARLAESETRFEVWDGELVYVSPADGPHGTRHSKISAIVEAHAGDAFEVASDMLTRTSETSDVAPDVSVFPAAPDPHTGGRQLEHLAFEVVSTQRLSRAGKKAAKLVARGVRRVFAIDVERVRALEWSGPHGTWGVLAPEAVIEDPALAVPLPVAALLRAAKADDVIARALIAKRNPEIEAFAARRQAEGQAQGRLEGLAQAVLDIVAARGLALVASDRARILAERDPDRLARWIARAAICATAVELFAEP